MHLLRDRREELERVRISPFGISRDSPWSHVAWREALDVDVPLLSDWNGDAVRAYRVAQEYRGLADVPTRSAFLVDGDRIVRFSRLYETDELPDLDEIFHVARRELE